MPGARHAALLGIIDVAADTPDYLQRLGEIAFPRML
jgi:hypothetical protein